jgi:hypothetical protein
MSGTDVRGRTHPQPLTAPVVALWPTTLKPDKSLAESMAVPVPTVFRPLPPAFEITAARRTAGGVRREARHPGASW